MTIDELARQPVPWLSAAGHLSDVVISSRVRLARNLAAFPFLTKASEGQRDQIYRSVADAVTEGAMPGDCWTIDVDAQDEVDREVLVERHLISRQHAQGEGRRGVILSADESRSVMVNEEDHLRIQGLRPGLELEALWKLVNAIDDQIDGRLEYAYDSRFGYLTACPTNVGTGIRVSVMLHLPALKITQEIERVARAAQDMRLAVRGLHGEGTDAVGDFFQLSNQTTLGRSEEQILDDFGNSIVPKIVEYERTAREALLAKRRDQLDDKIWRAFGLLRHARIISSEETFLQLSHLRLGIHTGRFSLFGIDELNELTVAVQPAHLQKERGQRMRAQHRGIARAQILRDRLARYEAA